MLEAVCFDVDLIPAEAERLHQIQLQKAVMTDHLERHALAGRRERRAVVALVLDEPEGGEPLQHARGGRGADGKLIGDRGGRGRAVVAELPDRLEVVLRRFTEHSVIIV